LQRALWRDRRLSVKEDLASLDDRELVRRAQEQDARAFAVLVARYQVRVRRLCAALTADPDAAEELAQVTWVKAFEAVGHLRDGERFFGWLRQIAVNHLRDGWRRHKLPQLPFDDALHDRPDTEALPDEQLLRAERQVEIAQALASLSLHDRRILALRYEQDLSYHEIAGMLHTTEGTVATWLYRAKERLRKAMDQPKGRQR